MKLKKYKFVTALLIIYATFMTLYFGMDLLKDGQTLRFWATLIGECCVIVLAFFALRRRDRIREKYPKN